MNEQQLRIEQLRLLEDIPQLGLSEALIAETSTWAAEAEAEVDQRFTITIWNLRPEEYDRYRELLERGLNKLQTQRHFDVIVAVMEACLGDEPPSQEGV